MKFNMFFKSTFRQPLRTLLLFLIIGLSVFMTVSRASEYFALKQETDRLSGYYRAIARVEATSSEYNTEEAMEYLESNRYVNFVDRYRYMSVVGQGDLYNMMFFKYENGTYSDSNMFFYGTLKRIDDQELPDDSLSSNTSLVKKLTFIVDTVLVGYPEYIMPGMERAVIVPENYWSQIADIALNERYFVRANRDFNKNVLAYGKTEYSGLRLDIVPVTDDELLIHAEADIDLTAPEYAELNKIMHIVDDNQHAFGVEATRDSSTIPFMLEETQDYYLVDGRKFTIDDDRAGNRVCLIYTETAEHRGLHVGDTIDLELRNLIYPFCGYIVDEYDYNNAESCKTSVQTFEIVGIYGSIKHYDNDLNDILIPLSSVPDDFEHETEYDSPYYMTVVLNSAKDVDAFIVETEKKLESYGLKTVFIETGYQNFRSMSDPMISSSITNAVIYSVLSALVLAIAVFIYFFSRRKDFATARALGASKVKCAIASVLPILSIGVLSMLIGSILAWKYSTVNIQNALTKFSELGIETANTELSVYIPVITAVVILIFLILAAILGSILLGRRSVLELLQGGRTAHEK